VLGGAHGGALHARAVRRARTGELQDLSSGLKGYCTEAAQASTPSTQTRLAFRWHSLVFRCCFGKRIVCGVGRGNSVGKPSSCDRGPRPLRPRRRGRSGAGDTPLAALQADRGVAQRCCGRPADRGNAPAPISAQDVLCLFCAAQAITVKSALVSFGRSNSPASRPPCRRFDCVRGG
jgi:hypothetical protein